MDIKKKLNRNAFNEKLIHRYLIERYYFGDKKNRERLLPEIYRKAKINLVVPEEVNEGTGYRADLTLYIKGISKGVPVEVKWAASKANKQNQLDYLKNNNGFLVVLSDGHRPKDIPTVIIDTDDFTKWIAENISKLTRDSISTHVARSESENPQRWLVFLRGTSHGNFKKMLAEYSTSPFWAFKQNSQALRHILDVRRGDKCIYLLGVSTNGQNMSKNSKLPIEYYSWYSTTVVEPNYMQLGNKKGTFFEESNIPVGERRWPHFIDFKIDDSYESNSKILFGESGEWTDAIVNSNNFGKGAPQPLSERLYEQLIDKLRHQKHDLPE